MVNDSSQSSLGTRILLLVVLAVVSLAACALTVALMQARQKLQQVQSTRPVPDRWRLEVPAVSQNGGAESERLRAENMALRNEVAQLRSQRALDLSRSTVRTFSPNGRSISTTSFRPLGVEKPPRNKEEEDRFLAENKNQPGVVTLPSGLQYRVIWPGFGRPPQPNELVNLNYRGSLIDGTEIDSSYVLGQSAEFSVSAVMAGWKEALLLMPAGAKWQLFIPSELGYGERGLSRRIPANATLIYEIELISIRDRNSSVSPAAFASGPEGGRPPPPEEP
jgi:FKBP-type peptidyl-prolyl cis-trans isomerase